MTLRSTSRPLEVMLPRLTRDVEEVAAVMGPSHWPYGFQENYRVLDAMCQFHFEQGLSSRRLTPEELFAPETHDAPAAHLRACLAPRRGAPQT